MSDNQLIYTGQQGSTQNYGRETDPNKLQNQSPRDLQPLNTQFFEKYNYSSNHNGLNYHFPKAKPIQPKIARNLSEMQNQEYTILKKSKAIEPSDIVRINSLNQRRFSNRNDLIKSKQYQGQILGPNILEEYKINYPKNRPVVSKNYEFPSNYRRMYHQDYEINREDLEQFLEFKGSIQVMYKNKALQPDTLIEPTAWEEEAELLYGQ